MYIKMTALITLACFVICLPGCYTTREVPGSKFETVRASRIVSIVTNDGRVHEFIVYPNIDRENKIVHGITKNREAVDIPFSEIQMVYVKKFNAGATVVAIIGVIGLAAIIGLTLIALLKESCPFVYSFDGQQYVFDGEPYGGAICPALQRTDLCRLDHLQPVDNEYRLLLTNEVNETQYTDELKLWVIDHPGDVEVIQDADGNLYTIQSFQPPVWVRDHNGRDWMDWLSKKDLLYWESDILSRDPSNPSDFRDTLFMAFPKPADAATAKLVVHGCNTLWGSQMLRRIVELGGEQVQAWYDNHYNPEQIARRAAWNDREEVFELHVYVNKAGEWVKRGEILGGGPFMAEERVVPLDVSDLDEDTLQIRVAPPAGFWKLNSFFIDYSPEIPFEVREISAMSAIGDDGTELRAILDANDGNYHVMPEMDQCATLTFAVPPAAAVELKRTVLAKVSGYYDMHMDASGPPQYEIIARILTEPGYIVKFALEEYSKWHSETLGGLDE